ncbi:ABC transporter permease [Reinekea thalattae]|uniref:ABC transporter permease n=1 Tax=Reinekea thalattae TaxID=2593301 RepID=A0A5C8ZC82_9GAMM|nr:ABC transporter permease [Reinekea thalattae]TXR54781.1 ABC transporter permease [Reinekea thalattae]
MEYFQTVILILDATLRVATPLIFAALAGLFSERSGVVDIGLEGKILASAFAGAAAAYVFNSPWMGLIVGVLVSVSLAMLHGFATVTHRGDQVVSGMAINILAMGLTASLGNFWFHQGGNTPNLVNALENIDARFTTIVFPFAEQLKDVPIIGGIYSELLSGHFLLVYLALAAVPLSWFVLFKTRFGLRLRAVGENPTAVDTAGISVVGMRYMALAICGALAGLAGVYLSVAVTAQFLPNMSAGKGYMALAALIFGKWRPRGALLACLMFGILQAIADRSQGAMIGSVEIPVQLIEALPYILTVVLLGGFIGTAIAPKAIGRPYVKERE